MASARERWELPFAHLHPSLRGPSRWALALGLIVSTGAWAADPTDVLPDSGWITLLPPEAPVVEGEPVRLQVLAVDGQGAPMQGLKLKATASQGEATGWEAQEPGIYAFDLHVPSYDASEALQITLQGRTPARAPVQVEAELPVTPRQPPPTAVIRPSTLTLGRADGGTLIFDEARELVVRSIAGEVRNLTDMGDRKTARFDAPTVNFPHLELITFAEKARPFDAFGHVAVRLQGSVSFPVQGPAGAGVLMKVAGGEFGPEVFDDEGKARVSIVVPPGTGEAVQVNVVEGEPSEVNLDLGIPETQRLALFPLPAMLPGDARTQVPVRAVVKTAAGDADLGAKPEFSVSQGSVGPVRHQGEGIYEATWTLADASEPIEAKLQVRLDSEVQSDELTVNLAPLRPDLLAVEQGEDQTVWIFATHADGRSWPLTDENLVVDLFGAELASVEEEGDARVLKLLPEGEGPIRVEAHVRPPPSPNPLAHVWVLPTSRWVASDGASQVSVVIATVDAFGYPVPQTEVRLSSQGAGQLDGAVVTDERGTARVTWTAGERAELVRIQAEAQQVRGEGWLVSSPEPLALDLPAPQGLAGEWARLVGSLTVDDGASTGVVSAASTTPEVAVAPADAPLETLELTHPESARPGEVVQVRAAPLNAKGQIVAGQTLDFLTSVGSFTHVEELDGAWTGSLALPEDASGEVKLSVIASDGTLQATTLRVDPTLPAAEEAVAALTESPSETREPPARPWFRARLSGVGSFYSYEQAPSSDPGPLLPRPLVVGGQAGRPATPMGGELSVRAWLPTLPYLGFQGVVRSTRYAVDATALGGLAVDTLINAQLDLTGRVPFQVGTDSYWIGAKAGLHYNDFMLYTGCMEPGCVIEYDNLGLSGLAFGPEMGAEIDRLYFVAGYALGLVGLKQPYSHTVDVNLGYQITRNVFVDLGLTSLTRRVTIRGTQSQMERGHLADHQTIFTLGGGISL